MNRQSCSSASVASPSRPAICQADWDAFCRDPGPDRFRPIYEQSHALVWTLCMRILRDPEDAQDALQSVYCRLLQTAREPDRDHENLSAREIIYRTAVREANRLRMRRRRKGEREVAVDALTELSPQGNDARANLDQAALRERVEGIVASLPERYRLPVMLHYFDGMTHREVAEAMGAPVSTVSNRLARAHRRLEPALRRAGLGSALALLAFIHAHAAPLEPPFWLTADAVYASARRQLLAGSISSVRPHSGGMAKTPFLHVTKAGLVTLTLLSMVAVLLTLDSISARPFASATPPTPADGTTQLASVPNACH